MDWSVVGVALSAGFCTITEDVHGCVLYVRRNIEVNFSRAEDAQVSHSSPWMTIEICLRARRKKGGMMRDTECLWHTQHSGVTITERENDQRPGRASGLR